jgi:hypothetical protein
MAFNPLSSFRKYPKIWMAGVTLLCMVTFVLCTGVGGDFGDTILRFFRGKGDDYVKVGGKRYNYTDIEDLKDQRNVANDFMRTLSEMGMRQIDKRVKSATPQEQKDPDRKQQLALLTIFRDDLFGKVTREQRYFHGGTKLNDLIDFIVWLQLADKYDIQLTDDDVRKIVSREVHANAWGMDEYASREAQNRVRQANYKADDATIMKALRNEFRARIAMEALLGRYAGGATIPGGQGITEREHIARSTGFLLHSPMQIRIPLTPDELFNYYNKTLTKLDFEMLPVSLEQLAEQVPDPGIKALKEFYDKNAKNPYNPNLDKPGFLLPAQVKVQYVTANPGMEYYKQPAQLMSVLQKTPPVAYNPMMPLAGLIGQRAADPAWENSLQTNYEFKLKEHRQKWQEYLLTLQILQAQKKNEEADGLRRKGPPVSPYSASPWTTPYYWSPDLYHKAMQKPNPANAAALIGAMMPPVGGPGNLSAPFGAAIGYQADAYLQQYEQLKPMVKADRDKRIVAGSELILTGLQTIAPGSQPFAAASLVYNAENQPSYLPVAGFVEEELRTAYEDRQAQAWMNTAMIEIKAALDKIKGRKDFPERLDPILQKYQRKEISVPRLAAAGSAAAAMAPTVFGWTLSSSKDVNEFDIETDPHLKALLDSFERWRKQINTMEGRGGKPDMLKEGDFYKLFFGADPIGIGATEPYVPGVWPPAVTPKKSVQEFITGTKPAVVDLFRDDNQPIIYWKTAKKGPEVLTWQEHNPVFMSMVLKQYKLDKARENIFKKVKDLTAELKQIQRTKDVRTKLRDLAKGLRSEIITLRDVALLMKETHHVGGEEVSDYDSFLLKRGVIPFAREDTVKLLLQMNKNQSAPIKLVLSPDDPSALKEIDNLNESLFLRDLKPEEKKAIHQIQVLTNRPRTIYYIVTLAEERPPSKEEFYSEIMTKAITSGREQNRFVDKAQEERGKELLAEVLRQLKGDGGIAEVWMSDSAKKNAESEASAQH